MFARVGAFDALIAAVGSGSVFRPYVEAVEGSMTGKMLRALGWFTV